MVLISYIGGKTRVASEIADYIPKDTTLVVSPFFGGGSVEFRCAARGMTVLGYDLYPELVHFWQELKRTKLELADAVECILPMTKTTYKEYRNCTDTALGFFIVNKCSFNGIMGGSYSPQLGRIFSSTPKRIRKFNYPERVSVHLQDFTKTLAQHQRDFLFLDPPYYDVSRTYGLRSEFSTIDHEALALQLEQHRGRWLLVYNDHPWVRMRYANYEISELVSRYGSNRRGLQVLISNYNRGAIK